MSDSVSLKTGRVVSFEIKGEWIIPAARSRQCRSDEIDVGLDAKAGPGKIGDRRGNEK